MDNLESYFQQFRKEVIGLDHSFANHYGKKRMIYADWIASGKLYKPIEVAVVEKIAPAFANVHSFSSQAGKVTTSTYKTARRLIKKHVNAHKEDILVTTGTGMTGALNTLQRILGLRYPTAAKEQTDIAGRKKPVVFITHMEHHSNQVSWFETIADVVIVPPDEEGMVSPKNLEKAIEKYWNRELKIGSFTACSNVTGIITPYKELARIMHKYGGKCFIDFAASAPYEPIDMHPQNKEEQLDAIFFSPHKFLGGPGTCGILLFDKTLYRAKCPENPGGGNVRWTNPWGQYSYFEDIETKEDGGTPGILQVIRAALCLQLKDKMTVEKMQTREKELVTLFMKEMRNMPRVHILGDNSLRRIGCCSFTITGIHYNLVVRLLNDRFGIQARGGWSCASSYGHFLFGINRKESTKITDQIEKNNLSSKPGWVRISLHPVMTNSEVEIIVRAIGEIIKNSRKWKKDYNYNSATNEYDNLVENENIQDEIDRIFVV